MGRVMMKAYTNEFCNKQGINELDIILNIYR